MKFFAVLAAFFFSFSSYALTLVPMSKEEALRQNLTKQLARQAEFEQKYGPQECFIHPELTPQKYRISIDGSKKREGLGNCILLYEYVEPTTSKPSDAAPPSGCSKGTKPNEIYWAKC